jgi:hypothetical protein
MGKNREELHELRRRAHEAGIEGNSKMTVEELKTALAEVEKGRSPQEARAMAKQH